MKKILFIGLCASAMITLAANSILRPEQLNYIQSQRMISSKDLTTIPGKCIIYYVRNGRPDGCITQDCFTVTSGVRKNPFMYKMIDLTNTLHQVRVNLQNIEIDRDAISNRFATVQSKYSALKARNQEARENLDELIQRAPLLKALIERIKDKIAPDDDDD